MAPDETIETADNVDAPAPTQPDENGATSAAELGAPLDTQTVARLSGAGDEDIEPTNTLVSDDELLAALSEVGDLADGETPDLNDSQPADQTSAADAEPQSETESQPEAQPEPPPPEVADTPDSAAASDTPVDPQTAARLTGASDEDIEPSNSLVSDDELLAALSEVEALGDAGVPDLDDGAAATQSDAGSADPQRAPQKPAAKPNAGPAPDPDDPLAELNPFGENDLSAAFAAVDFDGMEAEEEGEATEDEIAIEFEAEPSPPASKGAKLRFQLGKKPEVVVAEQSDESSDERRRKTPAAPRTSWRRRVYRLVDQTLDLINRPFGWVPASVRQLVGHLALVTIVMSLLAGTIIPAMMRARSAVRFVQLKRAALEQDQRMTPASDAATDSTLPATATQPATARSASQPTSTTAADR